jgi:hypothetical protein
MASAATPSKSPSASTRTDKSKKQTKVIVLKLSPKLLRRFTSPKASIKSEEQSSASQTSSPRPTIEEPSTLKVPEVNDAVSETASTPAPGATDPTETTNGNGVFKPNDNALAGMKRGLGQMSETNGTPKPRGKPGPKKKPRLYVKGIAYLFEMMLIKNREDGTIDHSNSKPANPAPTGVNHKLGPKANTGAINNNLRNLDRSGKPCRKWAKKTFAVKSFTGVIWELPSWKAPERPQLNGEESSDAKDISLQSSSEAKPNESDAAMDSNAGDRTDVLMSTPPASSPAPMPPPATAIAA